jgi:hypothetical protein
MDSQDPRFTTPPPYDGGYGNIYDAETPPSAQPRSLPLSLPDSQKTTQSWDSQNGPHPPQTDKSQPAESWGSRDFLTNSQLLPDSLTQPSPPLFVPDSQAESSQELSQGPKRHYTCAPETSRDLRLQIQIALLFRIPHAEIKQVLDVTDHQIKYARNHRPTPQKGGKAQYVTLHTPQKEELKKWLLASPSHRHVSYYKMPHHLPQLHAKEAAFRTAIRNIGYCRQVSRKKGFSDDPAVYQERLDLAEDGSTWPRSRIQSICFPDEVWAFGGAHTSAYITCLQDGSDRLLPECVRHKYSKLPAWMFWGSIVEGKKGPSLFWEKA